jgi:hypothetical protein
LFKLVLVNLLWSSCRLIELSHIPAFDSKRIKSLSSSILGDAPANPKRESGRRDEQDVQHAHKVMQPQRRIQSAQRPGKEELNKLG